MPSGGGGSQKVKQSAEPWSGQQPYLREIFQEAQDLYTTGGPEMYQGNTTVDFTQPEVAAQQMAMNAAQGGQTQLAGQAAEANQFLMGDVLKADSNPYMADYASAAIRPVMQQLTEQALPAIASGRIAAGQVGTPKQSLSEAMAIERATRAGLDTTSQMYSDMYGQNLEALQRGIALAPQTQAAQLTPAQTMAGVGAQQRAYEQSVLNDEIRRFESEEQMPWSNLAAYQNMIQGNYGGHGTATTSGGGASTASQLLGAGMTGLGTYGTIMGNPAMAAAMGPAAPWVAGGMALASLFA